MSKSIDEGVWRIEQNLTDYEDKVFGPSQWSSIGNKAYKAFAITHKLLPPAVYGVTIDNNDGRSVFTRKVIKNDKIMSFRGGVAHDVLKEIEKFWTLKEKFKENEFLHRRGYLFYGPQGTGKSSIVSQIVQSVIADGGVVFVCDNPKFFNEGLRTFRAAEPIRPIVCVFEDIDAIIDKYGEAELLSLLDGDSQIDGVINIATTNYPEKLDKRIVSRPRRFDRIHKIEVPSEAIRNAFLKEKLPKNQNLKIWIKKTKGLSFAALSEVLISVLCLGNNLDETIKLMRDLESKSPKSSDFGKGIGFKDGEDTSD